jgi:hypothetical protein
LGNCQIAALRPLLQALHGDLDSPGLPAVHTMTAEHEKLVAAATVDADWIVAQLVAPDYHVEYVRTDRLLEQFGERVIIWPNLYFTGYAPEYNTLRDAKYRNFTGPLLDYHSDKILYGFMQGWPVAETVAHLQKPSNLDVLWYDKSVSASLAELKKREEQTSVSISDFVEETFAKQRLFYIMNHPAIATLSELASRILAKMNVKALHDVPGSLFGDLELLSAWHPENAYIREKYALSFTSSRLYRGVRMSKADNALGVAPDGPRIYDELEIVEAMYRFYEPFRDHLKDHGRVVEIMRRPCPSEASLPPPPKAA